MVNKNQTQSLLEQIFSSSRNLKKDIDQNDPREKTQEDLTQLTLSFQDLRDLFSKMSQQDAENLKREFRELLSGEEDFQTYAQDVKKILAEVNDRIRTDKKVEQKFSDNLPEDKQDETPQTLLEEFKHLLDQLSQGATKAGGRR